MIPIILVVMYIISILYPMSRKEDQEEEKNNDVTKQTSFKHPPITVGGSCPFASMKRH